jgi:lycopene cyclase domain-containing protein
MFGNWTYVIWLSAFVGVPLIGLGLCFWRLWWRERRALGWTLAGAGVGGCVWDFTAIQLGFWSFSDSNIVGVIFLGLPLEEWLWIFGVTWLFAGIALVLADKTLGAAAADGDRGIECFSFAPLALIAWVPTAFSQFLSIRYAPKRARPIYWHNPSGRRALNRKALTERK